MRRRVTLEVKHVERPVCNWADERNIMHRKLNGEGNAGWPDREFFIDGGRPFLIEFKIPGEPLKPLQEETINKLLALGYDVEVHTYPEMAKTAILKRQREAAKRV